MFVQVWRLFRPRAALNSPLFLPLRKPNPSLHGYCSKEDDKIRWDKMQLDRMASVVVTTIDGSLPWDSRWKQVKNISHTFLHRALLWYSPQGRQSSWENDLLQQVVSFDSRPVVAGPRPLRYLMHKHVVNSVSLATGHEGKKGSYRTKYTVFP